MESHIHVDPEGRVTVPAKVCAFLGWKPGDKVEFEARSDGSLRLFVEPRAEE